MNNNIFYINIKDNLEKNLIQLYNECITNIFNFKEAYCSMILLNQTIVKEILPGIEIFKNFNTEISHNCNKFKIKQKGNFIIRFKNCIIETLNRTYLNVNIKVHYKIILPNIIKIKKNNNDIKI